MNGDLARLRECAAQMLGCCIADFDADDLLRLIQSAAKIRVKGHVKNVHMCGQTIDGASVVKNVNLGSQNVNPGLQKPATERHARPVIAPGSETVQ